MNRAFEACKADGGVHIAGPVHAPARLRGSNPEPPGLLEIGQAKGWAHEAHETGQFQFSTGRFRRRGCRGIGERFSRTSGSEMRWGSRQWSCRMIR